MSGPIVPNQALLNGINPLAYMGVRPSSPALFLVETRDPLTTDKNYALGTWWMNNNSPYNLWRLANLNAGVALWIMVSSGAGSIISLTSNSGGPVFPLAGNINVVGDGVTITGVGNPGTHTITFSAVGTGLVDTLTGNSGGPVSPLAGNINVVGDGTTINVVGNPGTHTLTISAIGTGILDTLTGNSGGAVSPLAGNINVVGDAVGITIAGNPGTHTLTASLINGGSATIGLKSQDGNTVTPTAGIINVSGSGGLTTTGTVGPNTLTITLSTIPAFGAYLSATVANFTGDGSTPTIVFDTKVFDNLTNYNAGTGIFTAPQTGVYQFSTFLEFNNVSTQNLSSIRFVVTGTSANVYGSNGGNPSNAVQGANIYTQTLAATIFMTSGDTCKVVGGLGGGPDTLTVGIAGAAAPANPIITYFSGSLVH